MSGEVFDSGKVTVKKITVIIPFKLLWICNSIQKKLPHKEFSILAHGEYDDARFVVGEEFIIPDQEVAGASVDFTSPADIDRLRTAGWNVVLHSHPFDMPNFSGSDDETINSNFDCSILYSLGDFKKATLRLTLPDGSYLQLDGSIEGSVPELAGDVDVSMIHEKTYTPYSYQKTLAGDPAYDRKTVGQNDWEDEAALVKAEEERLERIQKRGGRIACGLESPEACDCCYNIQCIDCKLENLRYMQDLY